MIGKIGIVAGDRLPIRQIFCLRTGAIRFDGIHRLAGDRSGAVAQGLNVSFLTQFCNLTVIFEDEGRDSLRSSFAHRYALG